MSSTTDLDAGPLTWVKGEIDLALGRATEAIEAARASAERSDKLQFAQTHLHQVRGALSIVGLDGLTAFADALDRLLAELARGERDYSQELADLALRSLAAVGNYLDELSHGVPDQSLRLMPLYREIAAARGLPRPGPADLFYPDLGQQPPRKGPRPASDAAKKLVHGVRKLRTQFQTGLLSWLRKPGDAAGPLSMAGVCAEVERLQSAPTTRSFWWSAGAFFDTLANGAAGRDPFAKYVASRIDLQLKRIAVGQVTPPERLHREMLYLIATAPQVGSSGREVRDTYQLDTLLPPPGSALCEQPLAPLLARLRTLFAATRDTWDHFAGGAAAALPQFDEDLRAAIEASAPLGRPAFRHLLDTLAEVVQWLRKDPLQINDLVGLEVASAIMLAETALDTGRVPDASFTAQVARAESRLKALVAGEDLAALDAEGSDMPDATREAQERLALGQLAREMQVNLANIEQTLDEYFRRPERKANLANLNSPLRQIEGVLTVLGETRALEVLKDCERRIEALAGSEEAPPEGEFEYLAHHLSAFGFFVQDLQRGNADLDRLLRGEEAEPPLEEAEAPEAELPPEEETEPEDLPEAPAIEEIATLDEGDEEEAVGVPETAAPVPPPPAPELLESSDEEIDSELLDIFLEEGREVVDAIGDNLAKSRANPHDNELVTTIRRGFHTLKGSGRMVGLTDLGEAAWGMEQTMNRWLQLEWEPTPALFDLIEAAHALFDGWIEQLAGGGSVGRDAEALLAEAQRLRESDEPIHDGALGAAPEMASAAAAETRSLAELVPDLPPAGDLELELGEESAEALEVESGLDEDLPELTDELPVVEEESDTLRETSLEFGDLSELEEEDDQVPPIGALEVLSGTETSLEADELVVHEDAAEAEPSTLDEQVEALVGRDVLEAGEEIEEIDFGDLDALELEEAGDEDLLQAEELELGANDAAIGTPPFAPLLDERATDEPAAAEAAQTEPSDEARAAAAMPAAFSLDIEQELPTEAFGEDEVASFSSLEDDDDLSLDEIRVDQLEAIEEEDAALDSMALAATEDEFGGEDEDPDVVRLGDKTISRPLFDLYLNEAGQHLETLKREIGHLRNNPTLRPPEASIRAAHTLAGISGTAHVESIQLLAKSLEHAQARFHDSDVSPAEEQTDLLARSVEAIEAMLVEVGSASLPLPVPELIEQLDGLLRGDFEDRPAAPQAEAPAAMPAEEAPAAAEEEPAAAVLVDEFDEQLLPIFLEEAADLLGQLQSNLRDWRADPADEAPVPGIARLLHTLKGSARMAGAMRLGEFVHGLETRLEERGGETPELIEELESGLDSVSTTLDRIAAGPEPQPAPAEAAPLATAPAVEVLPALAETESAASANLRVRADLVDKFVNEAGEIGIARTRIDGELRTLRRSLLDLTENVIRLRNQLREIEIQAETQLQSRIALSGGAEGEFDPLELDRFTRLQELTRMMAESVNDVTTVQHNLLGNLDGAEAALSSQARLNRDLQQALMRVRMVPFDSIADRLHRVVRQGAKDMGKRVTLDIRAGNTEIDRGVLERMTAPLEHLLRNSIAHGIEAPQARAAAGKAEIGLITLRFAQEGNEIAIELADDGAGLNFDRIRQRAIENGLVGAGEDLDEKRLTNLIFMPGFSTASSLSTVSGRGVGMDVVKSETAAVGGRIDIGSKAGEGTRFRIYLPVNLAVTQALLVRAGHRTYAIPSSTVAQVREMKSDELAALRQEGQLNWQDEDYAYRYLPRLVGDAETQPEEQRFNWVLLLRAGAQTLALHVDGLRGNQEIVVKNAGPHIARIVGISGATVMGDGEIVLIVNPVALATRPDVLPEDASAAAGPREAVHVPTVMVVDDSLTVRKITGRLLEREGYRVLTAKDGVDALERLIDTVPDVVLSDIEMPRMDGFDLARNIRSDVRLKDLPIIMITSRLADKHKEYAREIGVQHYLGKPYDEQHLLQLIADFAPLHATTH